MADLLSVVDTGRCVLSGAGDRYRHVKERTSSRRLSFVRLPSYFQQSYCILLTQGSVHQLTCTALKILDNGAFRSHLELWVLVTKLFHVTILAPRIRK
jgi:hypothetical protein